MKKKIFIRVILLFIVFSFLIISDVLASSDPFVTEVLLHMQNTNRGATLQNNNLTKLIRTIFAVTQMIAIGGTIIWLTLYSTRFFSSDTQVRGRAKDELPYRLVAAVVILGLNGMVAIIAKLFV